MALVALSAERERRMENVFHMLLIFRPRLALAAAIYQLRLVV